MEPDGWAAGAGRVSWKELHQPLCSSFRMVFVSTLCALHMVQLGLTVNYGNVFKSVLCRLQLELSLLLHLPPTLRVLLTSCLFTQK